MSLKYISFTRIFLFVFYRGTFGEQGTAMFAFERKGVVRVPCEVEGQESMNFDAAEELAIDIGAEEVMEGADDEGQTIFMVRININPLKISPEYARAGVYGKCVL